MRYLSILTLCLINTVLSAQVIDNAASYRNIGSSKYFRIHYENDYFSTTDIYYTQGINIEVVNPSFTKTFLPKTMLRFKGTETKMGISVEHLGYTPTSISHSEVLKGDRPFAACLFAKPFSITNDSTKLKRITSSLSLGVIGPAAGGKQIQETLHRWIHDTNPKGWNNQISNDIILNYQIDIEQALLNSRYLLLTAKTGAHIGTLSDKAYTSTILMGGIFDNPFKHFTTQKRKFQLYIYVEPQLNAVAYDASLQGGIFNHSSIYTIPLNNINRFVFQGNTGLIIKAKRFNIEYFQSFLSREFKTGGTHHWGGIRLGWYFR